MASKIFLLAIVLAAVTISECRPKASKGFSNDGVYNYKASDELNIGSYFASKPGNVKNSHTDSDSSRSESHEYLPQLSHGVGDLLSKLNSKDNNQQGLWKNSQQQRRKSQSQGQQQNSEEYQQQAQYQGQGYDTHSSRQQQKQYQQSSEKYDLQQQSGYGQQQSGYAQQQIGYAQQKIGYPQRNGYEYQQISEAATPVQVTISGNWKNLASRQNPDQQSSEEGPQKYSFPRQVSQKANSDESSSSSGSEADDEQRGRQNQQAQTRNQMYNKSNKQSSQQQSNKQINPSKLNNSGQQRSSEESMEIKKANKVIVKHNSGELQGRNVVNVQLMRGATTTSSEEGQSEERKYGGNINSIYRN